MKDRHKQHKDLYQAKKHIARNIRFLRMVHNLSQQTVARDLKMALTTYGHLEAARTIPDLELLYSLSRYYKVDLMYIVCFDIRAHLLSLLSHTNDTTPPETFINNYMKLSEGGKKQIRDRLQQLIDSEKDFNLYPWNYDK